jgi:hypothetical protein
MEHARAAPRKHGAREIAQTGKHPAADKASKQKRPADRGERWRIIDAVANHHDILRRRVASA